LDHLIVSRTITYIENMSKNARGGKYKTDKQTDMMLDFFMATNKYNDEPKYNNEMKGVHEQEMKKNESEKKTSFCFIQFRI